MITLTSIVCKNKDVPHRIIEEEAVLVSVDKGEVIHLNQMGAKIWDLIKDKTTVNDIVKGVCDCYETDELTAQKDVITFLKQLSQSQVINVS